MNKIATELLTQYCINNIRLSQDYGLYKTYWIRHPSYQDVAG